MNMTELLLTCGWLANRVREHEEMIAILRDQLQEATQRLRGAVDPEKSADGGQGAG